MSFTVTEQLEVEVDAEIAFDTLADHGSWREWMPGSFRPVGESLGTLEVGAAPRVRIEGLPFATPLPVVVFDRPREITWEGGPSWLHGRHTFLFEATASGVRITSRETWSGPIAALLEPILRRGAARVGRAQLAGIRKGALARPSRNRRSDEL